MMKNKIIIAIKGAGEVGSAIAHRLKQDNFNVFMMDVEQPLAVHRGTTFSEAIYDGQKTVENITAELASTQDDIFKIWLRNRIAVIVDPDGKSIDVIKPDVLIDAIMAKKNVGTRITDAPLVIGVGPGFYATKDVHVVIETFHNENLGKIILEGEALPDNRIPLSIGGYSFERAVHAEEDGIFVTFKNIGESVKQGELIAKLNDIGIEANIEGILRGVLRSGVYVKRGTKLIELDPEATTEVCYHIRDKMKVIAESVRKVIFEKYLS